MHRIIKNTLLEYIPEKFSVENKINTARIFEFNNKPIKNGKIVYLCEREFRSKDNFALQFARQKSKELNLTLKMLIPDIHYENKLKQKFINHQLKQIQEDFSIIQKSPPEILNETEVAALIIDFNPILKRDYLKKFDFKIYEIDGHNIIPARFVSDKQEYNAATLRRKIYRNIYPFLTEFENITDEKVEADFVLKDFIENKLPNYSELKNNPSANVLSGLSKYLNLGFISSQRVALEIIKSNVDNINKEAFLEELIIRKELADNFCLYSINFKDFSGVPNWAKSSLDFHKSDLRTYLYSKEEFEQAGTHDLLWNACQTQLVKQGVIHGYLRMYWAKKILEWTFSAEEALEIAIYLNDKYAFDAPSADGYVGILWAIGALHDRAFMDYPITGKVRRMTYESLRRKVDLEKYINLWK